MIRFPRVAFVVPCLLLLAAGCPSNDSGDEDEKDNAGDDAGADGGISKDIEFLSLDEGEFTVGAGEEVSYCVKLPMPKAFKGRTMAMVGWESDVPAPTHHYFMTYTNDSTEGQDPVPCKGDSGVLPQGESGEAFSTSGVLNTKLLFATGVGKIKKLTDNGYGAVIDADGTFVTNHHVLNTTDKAAKLHGRFKLAVKDASLVPHPIRSLVCSTVSLSVPAGKESSTTLTCLAPNDIDIVLMAGHGHALMSSFKAYKYDGEKTLPDMLYESHTWDSPDIKSFEEPLHLKKGEGITFTCGYTNGSDKNVKFGFTASDEMCVLFAGYALPEGNDFVIPPTLSGTAIINAKPFMATDSTKSQFFF